MTPDFRVVASPGELIDAAAQQRGLAKSTIDAADWLARYKPDALERFIGAHARRDQRLLRAHLSRKTTKPSRGDRTETASLF